jgi:hypothetical protein
MQKKMSGYTGRENGVRSYLASQRDSTVSLDSAVSFGTTEVREYERVLGDHPNLSIGLAIGWDYQEQDSVSVDDYEQTHYHDPRMESTSVDERCTILKGWFTEEELRDSEAKRIQQKQRQSPKQLAKSLLRRISWGAV